MVDQLPRLLGNSLDDALLTGWIRAARARMESAKGTGLEPPTCVERAELLRLRKQVSELEKENALLG